MTEDPPKWEVQWSHDVIAWEIVKKGVPDRESWSKSRESANARRDSLNERDKGSD